MRNILRNIFRYLHFIQDGQLPGNEQFLSKVAVRLYYDTDIEWELKNRRNSYYDTYIPDGSEMVKRLLLEGNETQNLFLPNNLASEATE